MNTIPNPLDDFGRGVDVLTMQRVPGKIGWIYR